MFALIAITIFVLIDHLGDLLQQLNLRRFMHGQAVQALRNSLEVVVSILGVALAHRSRLRFAIRELGMAAPVAPGLTFAGIASAPMLIAFGFGFSINREMTFLSIGVGCLIAPFAEELIIYFVSCTSVPSWDFGSLRCSHQFCLRLAMPTKRLM